MAGYMLFIISGFNIAWCIKCALLGQQSVIVILSSNVFSLLQDLRGFKNLVGLCYIGQDYID